MPLRLSVLRRCDEEPAQAHVDRCRVPGAGVDRAGLDPLASTPACRGPGVRDQRQPAGDPLRPGMSQWVGISRWRTAHARRCGSPTCGSDWRSTPPTGQQVALPSATSPSNNCPPSAFPIVLPARRPFRPGWPAPFMWHATQSWSLGALGAAALPSIAMQNLCADQSGRVQGRRAATHVHRNRPQSAGTSGSAPMRASALAILVATVVLTGAVPAAGYWSAGGTGAASASVDTLAAGNAPAASASGIR